LTHKSSPQNSFGVFRGGDLRAEKTPGSEALFGAAPSGTGRDEQGERKRSREPTAGRIRVPTVGSPRFSALSNRLIWSRTDASSFRSRRGLSVSCCSFQPLLVCCSTCADAITLAYGVLPGPDKRGEFESLL
jgi:hypothetical protein